MNQHGFAVCVLLLVLAVGAPLSAQSEPPDPPDRPAQGELRDAMRSFFENRLRSELGLTDEQMTEILPMVEEIERSRNASRQERQQTVRALQDGMQQGATDAELQEMLDRLDGIEQRTRATERETLRELDQRLTVRQRVQFRFFTERFRRQLQNRIQNMRRDRMEGGERPRPPRRP